MELDGGVDAVGVGEGEGAALEVVAEVLEGDLAAFLELDLADQTGL